MKSILQHILILFLLVVGFASCAEKPQEWMYAPSLFNEGATDIGRNSVTLNGRISGRTNEIETFGFKYSTSSSFPEDQTTLVEIDASPAGSKYSQVITGLEPNTPYYFTMYASSGYSVVTAEVGQFTTSATSSPQFGELVVEPTESSITASCSILEVGDEYLLNYGVSYRPANDSKASFQEVEATGFDDETTRSFTVSIDNLQPNTSYVLRAYAKNSGTADGAKGIREGYSGNVTSATLVKTSPTVTLHDVLDANVSATSAIVSFSVTQADKSGGVIDEAGFYVSDNNQMPTSDDTVVKVITSKTKVPVTEKTYKLAGLQPDTRYYVRAYAINTVDGEKRTGISSEHKSFHTQGVSRPSLEIINPTKTPSSFSVTADILNYESTMLTAKGFVWSTSNPDVTLENAGTSKQEVKDGGQRFAITVDSLLPNSRYYVRAYATYKNGNETLTGYSTAVSIQTDDFTAPRLSDVVVGNVSFVSAKVTSAIVDGGNGKVTEHGFVWAVGDMPTIDGNKVQIADGADFAATLTGLTSDTEYRVRAYAIATLGGKTEVSYSASAVFVTKKVETPSVSVSISEKSFTSLKTSALIENYDESMLVAKGIVWSKDNPQVKLEDAGANVYRITSKGASWTSNITNLLPSSPVYVRAFAIYQGAGTTSVTGYSDYVVGTTDDLKKPNLSISVFEKSTTSITTSVQIDNYIDSIFVAKGIVWSADNPQVTLDDAGSNVLRLTEKGAYWNSIIHNLSPSSRIYIRAFATYQISGVPAVTGYSDYVSAATDDAQPASLDNVHVSNVTAGTAELNCGISRPGNMNIEEFGYVYSKTEKEPTLENGTTVKKTGNFAHTLTGLTENTTYYIRAYVKCGLGTQKNTVYSSAVKFETLLTNRPPKDDDNVSPEKY